MRRVPINSALDSLIRSKEKHSSFGLENASTGLLWCNCPFMILGRPQRGKPTIINEERGLEEIRMRRICLAIVMISVISISLACERRNGGTSTSETGPIKVGIYGDLTGRTANFGQSTENGVRMAADEINKAGGLNGRQIELFSEDDQGRPEQAATVVTKLINQDKVHAVIGEVASGNSLAAAPICQGAKIPMISPSSTNPAVTEKGDYIFRVCFIDPFQGEVMAKFAINTLNAKSAAILSDFNSPYSLGLTQFFKENFTKMGGQIVIEQSYTQGDPNYTGQLTSIRAAKPDVIYIPGYYSEVGVIAKQAKQLGITSVMLGGDGWDAPQLWELGGEALNGAFMSNHYSVDDPAPAIQKFVTTYRARYNTTPDALAALGYDAMQVLANAIKTAGSSEGSKIRDAVASTKNFVGVTGTITINSQRNAVKPAVVLELRDRKQVYKETIQPATEMGLRRKGEGADLMASR
jgi:branched-chain amino acid transport system substrate-binding protein